MKRQIAMIVAGMISTLAVVGGTIAAAQSGAFTSSSTTIQPNGDITVPEITPTPEQQAYTVVETRTIVVTAQPEPTSTTEPAIVVNQEPSERETVLLARLNQAYVLLKKRDDEYQTKLKEAYDKLKTASVTNEGSSTQASAPASSSSTSAQAAAASPTSVTHNDDHQVSTEHHDDGSQTVEQHNTTTQSSQSSTSEPEGQDH
jgi:hypothetical protein